MPQSQYSLESERRGDHIDARHVAALGAIRDVQMLCWPIAWGNGGVDNTAWRLLAAVLRRHFWCRRFEASAPVLRRQLTGADLQTKRRRGVGEWKPVWER